MFKRRLKEYTKFLEERPFVSACLVFSKNKDKTKNKLEYINQVDEKIINYEKLLFNKEVIEDENKKYAEGNYFVNVSYIFKNSVSRVLSNLYPIHFKFRGKWVNSIEGVLQGIKYKNKHTQNLVLKYSGLDAYHTCAANLVDLWMNTQTLYWQGKQIKRQSKEYQNFLNELYLAASKNPIYKNALLSTGNKYLLHHIGQDDETQTVLTRYEYEPQLNTLRDFLRQEEYWKNETNKN